MLEKITKEKIAKLRKKPGRDFAVLEISTLGPGSLIRVTTNSGNVFFYEIINPSLGKAHSYKCKKPSSGYKGEMMVPTIFRIGKIIIHNRDSNVSAIKTITLL